MIKKTDAKPIIESLCHDWAAEQSNADLVHPSFGEFKNWLEARHQSLYLKFRSVGGAEDAAERWFDAALNATRFSATKIDLADILDKLAVAAAPESRNSVSLRDIASRLSRHTVTNDELAAYGRLKEAGSAADGALLEAVRAVFAMRGEAI